MKVYSKDQVDNLISDAVRLVTNTISNKCIEDVRKELNSMVFNRDRSLYEGLEKRIQTLEIDSFAGQPLREPPKPKHTCARRKIVKRLNEKS